MAKYIITSIPQYKDGGPGKRKKKKILKIKKKEKQNSIINYTPPSEETIVQGLEQPSYWNDIQSAAEQGKECPPGRRKYNEDCVTNDEYWELRSIESTNSLNAFIEERNNSKNEFNNEIEQLYEKRKEDKKSEFNIGTQAYYDTFKNSKKTDKIKPWQEFPLYALNQLENIYDNEGNAVIDPETGKQKQQTKLTRYKNDFLVNKTENGYYQLYPKDIANNRIIKNGFTETQFKNYWGLDPKQVKEQLGDVIKASSDVYNETVKSKILKIAIDQNITIEDAIKQIPKKDGYQKDLSKKFLKPTQKILDDAFDGITKDFSKTFPNYNRELDNEDHDVFFSTNQKGDSDAQQKWESKYHFNDPKYVINKKLRGADAEKKFYTCCAQRIYRRAR
jgi:hypothetical protein